MTFFPLLALALGAASHPIGSAVPETLAIAIGGDSVRHVALGFLNGFALGEAGDSAYAGPGPLPVHSVRGNASFGMAINREAYYRRFQAFRFLRKRDRLGIIHLVLSDGWPYPRWPYADSAGKAVWEGLVHDWITTAVDSFGLERLQVDPFNEPETLGGGSAAQSAVDAFLSARPVSATAYYAAWKSTVRYIRGLIPPYRDVRIVGPSISGYNPFVREFLRSAAADSVLPDVVSWHEIDGTSKLDLDRSVEDAREAMREYGIPERDIAINEYMDQDETRNPGIAIAFFAKLEASRVASAMRACWGDDCRDGSFNGLYARQGDRFAPRSLWWGYKWYADLSGSLIAPRAAPPTAAIGAWDAGHKRLDLLYADASNTDGKPTGTLVLTGLPPGLRGRCRLSIEVLRASGEAPYSRTPRLAWRQIEISGPSYRCARTALGPGDALRIRLVRE